jgi:hypothetical protein
VLPDGFGLLPRPVGHLDRLVPSILADQRADQDHAGDRLGLPVASPVEQAARGGRGGVEVPGLEPGARDGRQALGHRVRVRRQQAIGPVELLSLGQDADELHDGHAARRGERRPAGLGAGHRGVLEPRDLPDRSVQVARLGPDPDHVGDRVGAAPFVAPSGPLHRLVPVARPGQRLGDPREGDIPVAALLGVGVIQDLGRAQGAGHVAPLGLRPGDRRDRARPGQGVGDRVPGRDRIRDVTEQRQAIGHVPLGDIAAGRVPDRPRRLDGLAEHVRRARRPIGEARPGTGRQTRGEETDPHDPDDVPDHRHGRRPS